MAVEQTRAEKQAESFKLWIGGIDPAVTIEGRPDTIDAVIQYLADNDMYCISDFTGMEYPKNFDGQLKGGRHGLMLKIMAEVNKHNVADAQEQLAPVIGPESLLAMQSAVAAGSSQAIAALKANQQPSHVSINISERLKATTLENMAFDFLPAGSLTDWLATEAQKERAKGVLKPFIAVSIKKWVPSFVPHAADEDRHESMDEMSDPQARATQQLAQQLGAPVKREHSLSILPWVCGFMHAAQSYSAAGMWEFTACLAHQQNILQVALDSDEGGRRARLAVIYDKLVRAKWHNEAYDNRSRFDVNLASLSIDDKVLKQAEKEYDQQGRAQPPAKGSGKLGKTGKSKACFKCGEVGHIASDCTHSGGGKNYGGKGGGKRRRKE